MEEIKSSLTFKALLYPSLGICLSVTLVIIIEDNWPIVFTKLRFVDYFMTALLLFTLFWLFYLETYRKMTHIRLSNDSISAVNIFNQTSAFLVDDLDGFETSLLISRMGNFEEIRIKRKGKTVIFVSEFFHSNYWKIKAELEPNLKYLGGTAKKYTKQTMYKRKKEHA